MQYDHVIAELNKLPKQNRARYCENNGCRLDESADDGVMRVSFLEPGGLLDNYTAVVYDPSGLVMKANQLKITGAGANWYDARFSKVKKLFGGDMFRAEHLRGNWYRCGFT